MSKRHVRELSNVYVCIFADATYAFPTLKEEFERDLIRLQSIVKQRGLPVFLVDLPAVGKHLDRCLANGEYKLSGLPLTKRFSNRVPIPKFLRGLYLLVFNEDGSLKKDLNHEAILFLRQILFAAKKMAIDCGPERTEDEVLEFVQVDGLLPIPDGFWNQPTADLTDVSTTYSGWSNSIHYRSKIADMDCVAKRNSMTSFLSVLDTVSNIVGASLGLFHFQDYRFRHGPGAISESTSIVNKYSWRNWSDRLESVFPIADCGFHNFPSWAASVSNRLLDVVDPTFIGSLDPCARMVAVPKTYTRPRLIAAEPSEHQWCQQNIWHYFRTNTEKTWISAFVRFTDQSLNQDLCVEGSRSGSLATVDLSAASDRVTCHAVGQMFRVNPRLLLALRATRTRYVRQNLTKRSPGLIELRKFSTMGSACTFPVESIIFLSIALASILTVRRLPVNLRSIRSLSGEVSVFGDDLVVPNDSRELLFDALELLDFKVNTDKSYWTGRFRESCGVDAFDGVDVTPIFWRSLPKSNPESIASTVSVRNNFYSKFFLSTAAYLASTIRKANLPSISMDSGVCGFKSRVGPVVNRHLTRYNMDLHRMETLVPQLSTVVKKSPITDDSALLQYFTEDPSPFTKWKSGTAMRPRLKIRPRWVPTSDLAAQQGN